MLDGHKLKGEFALVRMKSEKYNTWLLIKKKDRFATGEDVTLQDRSVVSNATLEDIREGSAPRVTQNEGPAPAARPEAKPEKGAKSNPEKKKPAPKPAAPMPHEIRPMLATPVREPFDDPDWIFEIKLDGYR